MSAIDHILLNIVQPISHIIAMSYFQRGNPSTKSIIVNGDLLDKYKLYKNA